MNLTVRIPFFARPTRHVIGSRMKVQLTILDEYNTSRVTRYCAHTITAKQAPSCRRIDKDTRTM